MSEELAFEACADLANEILEKQGRSERYTGPQLLKDFVGQNFRGMMVSLQKIYGFTLPADEFDAYVDKELGKVIEKLKASARPCDGVMEVLEQLDKEKEYHLAVVSSSALSRVHASLEKINADKYFKKDEVYSAASSLPKPTSKPDPAVYLHACEKLGAKPEECVAIEDSKSGATAAKNAGIPLIGYIGPYDEDEKEKMTKILKDECGAIVVMNHWREFNDALKQVKQKVQ